MLLLLSPAFRMLDGQVTELPPLLLPPPEEPLLLVPPLLLPPPEEPLLLVPPLLLPPLEEPPLLLPPLEELLPDDPPLPFPPLEELPLDDPPLLFPPLEELPLDDPPLLLPPLEELPLDDPPLLLLPASGVVSTSWLQEARSSIEPSTRDRHLTREEAIVTPEKKGGEQSSRSCGDPTAEFVCSRFLEGRSDLFAA
jgi:hypothetical protein